MNRHNGGRVILGELHAQTVLERVLLEIDLAGGEFGIGGEHRHRRKKGNE
jgi:hypothetical protein